MRGAKGPGGEAEDEGAPGRGYSLCRGDQIGILSGLLSAACVNSNFRERR